MRRIRLHPASWSLATRLTVDITAIVVVVVAGITWLTVQREQIAFREEAEQQAEMLLNIVSVSAGDHLYSFDVDYLDSFAAELLEVPSVLSVFFYDREGLVLTNLSDPLAERQFQVDPFGAQLIASDDIILDWQPDRLVAGQAVVVRGQRIGAVGVEFSDTLLRAEVSSTVRLGIAVLVLAGLAGAGLAAAVSRSVTNPVRELVAATLNVAQGDLVSEVDVEGAVEVTVLGEAFKQHDFPSTRGCGALVAGA